MPLESEIPSGWLVLLQHVHLLGDDFIGRGKPVEIGARSDCLAGLIRSIPGDRFVACSHDSAN